MAKRKKKCLYRFGYWIHSNKFWGTRRRMSGSGFIVWLQSIVVFNQNTILYTSFTEIHEKLLKPYRQPIQTLCTNNITEKYKFTRPILERNKRKHSFLVIHDLAVIRIHTHTHTWCNENRSLALYATEHMDPSTNLSNTSKLYPTSLLWWRYAYLCVQTVLLAHLQCEGWIFTKKKIKTANKQIEKRLNAWQFCLMWLFIQRAHVRILLKLCSKHNNTHSKSDKRTHQLFIVELKWSRWMFCR